MTTHPAGIAVVMACTHRSAARAPARSVRPPALVHGLPGPMTGPVACAAASMRRRTVSEAPRTLPVPGPAGTRSGIRVRRVTAEGHRPATMTAAHPLPWPFATIRQPGQPQSKE